jgi:hypothetical protein
VPNTFVRADEEDDGLGSLAQSARLRQLRQASNILLFLAGWLFFEILVQWAVVNGEIRQGGIIDPEKIRLLRKVLYIVSFGCAGIAILYLIFAFKVQDHPVPITITALVLYAGFHLTLAAFSPLSLLNLWEVKAVVVVGLSKSILAAIAYESHRSKTSNLAVPVEGDRFDEQDDPESRPRRPARAEGNDW